MNIRTLFPDSIHGFKILTKRYGIDDSSKVPVKGWLIDVGVFGVTCWLANRVTTIGY